MKLGRTGEFQLQQDPLWQPTNPLDQMGSPPAVPSASPMPAMAM